MAPAARRLAGLLPLEALGAWMPPAAAAGAARTASTLGGGAAAAAAAGGGQTPSSSNSSSDDRLAPGAAFTLTKRYTPEEVAAFAASTGDSNAIHTSAAAAAAAGLPAPILPGLLMAALFPAIIGSQFPGALYLSQSLKFKQYALVSGRGGRSACDSSFVLV